MDEHQEHSEGRYVYCVVNSNQQDFSTAGIENNKVYLITHNGIGAIVHNCSAKPYESVDEDRVKIWILSHHVVIEKAAKKFSSVVPFTFDTIIKGNEENVKEWLSTENGKLKEILEKFKGKSEFIVQIFLDSAEMKNLMEKTDLQIHQIKKRIESESSGTAFMLKRKLEKMLNEKLSAEAGKYSKISYETIQEIPDEIKQEKQKKIEDNEFKDKEMILNLSCLVDKSKVDELGKTLDKISKMSNVSVRFTGPWVPYSFVEFSGNENETKK